MNNLVTLGFCKKKNAFVAIVLFAVFVYLGGILEEVTAQDISATATAIDGGEAAVADGGEEPLIDIWYGPDQVFGEHGTVQEWVNILGNVSDPDGVKSLEYSLNGGLEKPLTTGPDGKRLIMKGDFNIELAHGELQEGINEVIITATDELLNQASETVTIEYHSSNIRPFPYEIDWSEVVNIQDVAQVVDGKWAIGQSGLRTKEIGYDRLVAIGDVIWTDYEVVLPITIHRILTKNDNGQPPALGIIMRWTGHIEDINFEGEKPKTEWNRDSAIAWWHWEKTTKLEFDNNGQIPLEPRTGVPYMFKVRAETMPDKSTLYSVKAWVESRPEPDDWQVTYRAKARAPRNGSFLLLAHHVDASFGDITITGLAPLQTPTPLPTSTPTPTIANTPTATIFLTTTPSPSASESLIISSSDPGVKGTPDAIVDSNLTSSKLSHNSTQLYMLSFIILIVLLAGMAFAQRRLTS